MSVFVFNAFSQLYGRVAEALEGCLVNLFNRGYIYLWFKQEQVES